MPSAARSLRGDNVPQSYISESPAALGDLPLANLMRSLPRELVSLVHHVELNKSGWWDAAVERLVLGAVWAAGGSLPTDDLAEAIRAHIGTRVDPEVLTSRVDRLLGSGTLLRANGRLKIAEARLTEFERDRDEAERLVAATKARFVEELAAAGAELPSDEIWEAFEEKWLAPTICSAGARTYELIAGNYEDWSSVGSLDAFLADVPTEDHTAVRHAVARFLDPKDPSVRAYLLRMMDAYFIVEASRLSQRTVEALSEITGRQPSFTLFLDTNILFSILGLHGEDAREAATALLDMSRDLAGRVRVRLYALPATIDETRAALQRELAELRNLRLSRGLARAALQTGDLGEVAAAFAEAAAKSTRNLTPAEFLSPYISDLVSVLRERGIEVYNKALRTMAEDPVVLSDIATQVEFERKRYGDRAKSRSQITHDTVLWHVAHDKRPPRVESPADAGYWVVTEDYRLLGFDMHKRGGRNGAREGVPVALHPLALVQILQFWTGRTERMEEALMGGLRLSLVASGFDPAAEQTTITILETLGRYENVGDLPQSSIAHILVSEALREKLTRTANKDEQAALVRDELFAEHKRMAEALEQAEREKAGLAVRASSAEGGLEDANRRLSALEAEAEARRENDARRAAEIEARRNREAELAREAEAARLRQTDLAKRLQDAEQSTSASQEAERRAARRSFLDRWILLPSVVLALAAVLLGRFVQADVLRDMRVMVPVFALLLLGWFMLAAHVGSRDPRVVGSRAHDAISGGRKWLLAGMGTILMAGLEYVAIRSWDNALAETSSVIQPAAPPANVPSSAPSGMVPQEAGAAPAEGAGRLDSAAAARS